MAATSLQPKTSPGLRLISDCVLVRSARELRYAYRLLEDHGATRDHWYVKYLRQSLKAMAEELERRGLEEMLEEDEPLGVPEDDVARGKRRSAGKYSAKRLPMWLAGFARRARGGRSRR